MSDVEASRRIRELTTLNAIAETLNRAVDLRTALESALARLVELLDLAAGWVFLAQDASPGAKHVEVFYPAAACGLPPALAADDRAALRSQDCECLDLYKSGKFTHAVNVLQCSRLRTAAGDTGELRYHASVPLVSRDRVLGVLNVAGAGRETFSAEDLALLSAAGYQIGLAIERAQLYDLVRARRLEEQEALLKLSEAMLRAGDLRQLLDQLVQVAADVLAVDGAAVILESNYVEEEFRGAVRPTAGGAAATTPAATGDVTAMVGVASTVKSWSGLLDVDRGPSGWVLRHGAPLVIRDLASDSRWTHPLLAEREGFVGAAFVPLFQSGRAIGSLGVYCRRPHDFTDDEVRLLTLMGNQAAIAIEQARLHQQALDDQRLRRELEVASEIQSSFLPDTCPVLPGWSICGHYQAARQVGGDFYDFIPLPGGRIGVVIADVADKGMPAALFMALSRTLVRATSIDGRSPQRAILRANELILADSNTDMFVTLFYAALDPATGECRYVNAGHNPPLAYWARTGRVERLPGRGMPLGMLETIRLEEQRAQFSPGDALLLYTDGLTESRNAEGEEFGEARLAAILAAGAAGNADDVRSAILKAYEEFTGGLPAFDDVTMVVLKRTGEMKT